MSEKRSPYFVNAWVDAALLGGISILVYVIFRLLVPNERSDTVIVTATVLMWLVNWPHFAATSLRLYGSKQRFAQFPVTGVASVVVVVAGITAAVLAPETIAPWWLKLFMIWSPYHFSGQTVGLTMLYARRTGVRIDGIQRHALTAFVFGTFLVPSVRAETYLTTYDYYGVKIPALGLPEVSVLVVEVMCAVGGVVFLVLLVRNALLERRMPAPIILIPALTQMIWFLPGGGWLSFAEFVPFFHSVQYMLVAWAVHVQERKATRETLAWESVRWWLIVGAGGAVLFALFPLMLSVLGNLALPFATAVVIAGVQIHHFFVDGVIWKIKSEKGSSPLFGSVTALPSRAADDSDRRAA